MPGAHAAARQRVDTAAAPAAAAPSSAAPTGPAGWDREWADKFAAAGIDPKTMQQLNVLGGLGMTDAQLAQLLQKQSAELDAEISTFREKYPDEYAKLVELGPSKMPTWQLANAAAEVNSGKVSEKELRELVDLQSMMSPEGLKRTFLYESIPYALPGWGLWGTMISVADGIRRGDISESTNPISKRRVFGTTPEIVLAPLIAGGGAFTVANLVLGHQRARAGRDAVAGSPDAAEVAKNSGLSQAQAGKASLNPFSHNAKVLGGMARFAEVEAEVKQLERVATTPEELRRATNARNMLNDWKAGSFRVLGDSPVRFMKLPLPGFFSYTRGILPGIGNRGKELVRATTEGGHPAMMFDPRHGGKLILPQMMNAYERLASGGHLDALGEDRERALKGMPEKGFDPMRRIGKTAEAETAKLLLKEGADGKAYASLPAKNSARGILERIRPGTLGDTMQAVQHLDAGTSGKLRMWERLLTEAGPKWQGMSGTGRAGVAGAVMGAVGLGVYGLMSLVGGGEAAPAAKPAPAS